MKDLDKLKDIKPEIEVTGYNYNELLLIIAAIIGVILLLWIVSYFIKNSFVIYRPRVRLTRDQKALKALKDLKVTADKKSLYIFTENAKIVTKDSDRLEKLNEILEEIEQYKYMLNPPVPTDEVLKKIEDFIKDIK